MIEPTGLGDLPFHLGLDVAAHHREVLPHAVPQPLDLGVYLGSLGIPLLVTSAPTAADIRVSHALSPMGEKNQIFRLCIVHTSCTWVVCTQNVRAYF